LPQDAVFRKRFNKCKNEASKLKKNKGKNPSQYINFMAAPFFKDPVLSASPLLNSSPEFHNLSLQPEVKRLKLSDSRLKRKLDMNQNNLAGISDELAASKMKVVDLEDQIKNLKVENNLYKKKYAGSKSSHSTTPSSDGAKILEPNFVTIRPLSDKHPNIYERCEGGRGLRESYYSYCSYTFMFVHTRRSIYFEFQLNVFIHLFLQIHTTFCSYIVFEFKLRPCCSHVKVEFKKHFIPTLYSSSSRNSIIFECKKHSVPKLYSSSSYDRVVHT